MSVMRRCACPICGHELLLPEHTAHRPWTRLQLFWGRKLLEAGLVPKAAAKMLDVSVHALRAALHADREAG